MDYTITIDGPAGSGKSSVAKSLAKQLNFQYISSGYFYRAIAYYYNENYIDYKKPEMLRMGYLKAKIKLGWENNRVYLNNVDITNKINSGTIDLISSKIATEADVRNFVNLHIKALSKDNSIVIDGRDMGSVVLPDAICKIFLDADTKTRAMRRLRDLDDKGIDYTFEEALRDIIERDNRDYNRQIAPLRKADDAIVIDSSNLSLNQVVERIQHIFEAKAMDISWAIKEEN